MEDHVLRQSLNDELHGRPGLPVVAPARITHMAFTKAEHDADPLINVKLLCDAMGLQPPVPGTSHHAIEFDGGLFKFERHGEFYRISVTANGKALRGEAISTLPLGWVDTLPGQRLVAIHTHILAHAEKTPNTAFLTKYFGHDNLAGSLVSAGKATIWTDFRIGNDGYTRILIKEHGLSPLRLGRVTRRIHEIETYRMMALRALPLARSLQQELGPLEKSLTDVVRSMAGANGINDDAALLSQLSAIARDVEEMSNRGSYRFAAARAYSALVTKRVAELGEDRVANYQRIGIFLDRRFSPAMATCVATADRLNSLAERCARANDLMRTRVDIAVEGQNQQLLRSMESRAGQQLRLQETVEGLSVVAISYYLIAIIQKFIDGLAQYWPNLDTKLVSFISIPVVLVLVWLGIRRVRHRIIKREDKP